MKKIIISTGIILVITGLIFLGFYFLYPYKTGFINTEQVYNDFKLKIELEQKLAKTTEVRNNMLDSLAGEIELLSEEINSEKLVAGDQVNRFNVLRRQYLAKKEEFDQMNGELSQQYSTQIWKQLNQYIKEFGEKENYDYIYGAHGNGNLMYASDSYDLTPELKKFVNDRYEGGAK